MKVVTLALILVAVLTGIAITATLLTEDPDHPQVVPHPAGHMLVVNFAHADHVDTNCVECHHNFVDDTGTGMCFDCHKTDPEVADLIEEQFHDLCRDCHEEQQLLGEDHGPTRQCISCHVKDDRP